MKTNLFLPAFLVSALCSTIATAEPEITKIVMRPIGPPIKADSFAAKPKTLYRAGNKYARTEEELDAENNIHALIVVNEPDTWMINLADKTARHIVDPGPTFNFHAPILWTGKRKGEPDPDRAFKELEFGNELQFFRQHSAKDGGTRQIGGRNCKALMLKNGRTSVTLLVDATSGKPVQIDIERDGKSEPSIRYEQYKTDLPFQPSLFRPPSGIKITEGK